MSCWNLLLHVRFLVLVNSKDNGWSLTCFYQTALVIHLSQHQQWLITPRQVINPNKKQDHLVAQPQGNQLDHLIKYLIPSYVLSITSASVPNKGKI